MCAVLAHSGPTAARRVRLNVNHDDSIAHLRARRGDGKVVVVVGAGVPIISTSAETASWTGLLHHGIDRLEHLHPDLDGNWAARKHSDIDSHQLIELISTAGVVSEYFAQLGSGEKGFSAWLHEALGQLTNQISEPCVLEALKDIGTPLVTTNYDGLIEKATGKEAIVWEDDASVRAFLRGEESPVLHMHGYYRRARTVVFNRLSYQAVIDNDTAQFTLRTLLHDRCLLFVGCGGTFDDPNFETLRDWMRRVVGATGNRHFRLCRQQELDGLLAKHAPGEGIQPLPFGDTPQHLASFLGQIANGHD